MKERTNRLEGLFSIQNIDPGTKIEIIIPWEGGSYEEN